MQCTSLSLDRKIRYRWYDCAQRNRVVNASHPIKKYVFDTASDTGVISVEINIIMLEHLRQLIKKEIVLSLPKTEKKLLLLQCML